MSITPESPAVGLCPRCAVHTVRFDPNEERFEAVTNIPHTPARCERVKRYRAKWPLACQVAEWHPGIGGVDDLAGDDGYEVECGDPATHVVLTETAEGRDTTATCDGHRVMAEADVPGAIRHIATAAL